jgi:hypothetical protein
LGAKEEEIGGETEGDFPDNSIVFTYVGSLLRQSVQEYHCKKKIQKNP